MGAFQELTGRKRRRLRRAIDRACNKQIKKASRIRTITANTPYGFIDEHFTPFGGAFALEKLLDALEVEEAFAAHFTAPERTPKLGHWKMVKGIMILHFMGLQRLHQASYVKDDEMLKGLLNVANLPAVSTFWRCLNSYGLQQDQAFLKINAVVRERSWRSLGYDERFRHVHLDTDTTVKTIYGTKEAACKGHNRKHRGKRGLRPVMTFIAETQEYFAGKLRRGKTISAAEIEKYLLSLHALLPRWVRKVTLRADSEFYCWEAVTACRKLGYDYIIAVKKSRPEFDETAWYSVGKVEHIQYNSAIYQPSRWKTPCRYVAMRIRKDAVDPTNHQGELFEDNKYKYRIFVTSREAAAHRVIAEYDDRASAEKLIAEAHTEGLAAIPSKRFAPNRAFFQLAMLSYNLWRHLKAYANQQGENTWSLNSNRVSRLKLLYLSAKINFHNDQTELKYSVHLSVKSSWVRLLKNLDYVRAHREIWKTPKVENRRYLRPREHDRIVQKVLCTEDGQKQIPLRL